MTAGGGPEVPPGRGGGGEGCLTLRGRKETRGFRRVRSGAEAACPLPALPLGPAALLGLCPAVPGAAALPQPRVEPCPPAGDLACGAEAGGPARLPRPREGSAFAARLPRTEEIPAGRGWRRQIRVPHRPW